MKKDIPPVESKPEETSDLDLLWEISERAVAKLRGDIGPSYVRRAISMFLSEMAAHEGKTAMIEDAANFEKRRYEIRE